MISVGSFERCVGYRGLGVAGPLGENNMSFFPENFILVQYLQTHTRNTLFPSFAGERRVLSDYVLHNRTCTRFAKIPRDSWAGAVVTASDAVERRTSQRDKNVNHSHASRYMNTPKGLAPVAPNPSNAPATMILNVWVFRHDVPAVPSI